jgi:nucleotide-binding universal stress UspA family protein
VPTIVKEARENGAELIVLSWKGSFADGHGAVVKALLDAAPCPLLIVPAG